MASSNNIKIGALCSVLLILAACAGGTTPGRGAGGVSSAAPICVGGMDCMAKMNAARNWIAANSGLGLVVNTADTLETGGWGMPAYTSVRVQRQSLGGDRYWILADIQCGNSRSSASAGLCPDSAAAISNFNAAVSAAL